MFVGSITSAIFNRGDLTSLRLPVGLPDAAPTTALPIVVKAPASGAPVTYQLSLRRA